MPPNNLRAAIAQMYRGGSRQAARNLSSSSPPGSRKGEAAIATGLKSTDSSLVQRDYPSFFLWALVGFTGCYAWDTLNVWKRHKRFGERKDEFYRLKTSNM